jgi:hypothetical protein
VPSSLLVALGAEPIGGEEGPGTLRVARAHEPNQGDEPDRIQPDLFLPLPSTQPVALGEPQPTSNVALSERPLQGSLAGLAGLPGQAAESVVAGDGTEDWQNRGADARFWGTLAVLAVTATAVAAVFNLSRWPFLRPATWTRKPEGPWEVL